ncbi:hypothetical protein H9660_05265 [Clostridium sp. Sa3CUN1]|uniref:Uncharacterized protein n=1 Tax=Clostridium gallinarum TaxID=2762246 RepID=A0ABR8Q2A7_9CLOT|nr:hypothetical protein [Clostridium gallinarum]MBD7914547.1 hypothetical protein [Clostridium gallinarum]
MRVTKVMNASLLRVIKEYGTIKYSDLRKIYITPDPPGIISAHNACFDSDLRVLKEEGEITIEDGVIKYIQR